MNKEKRRQLAGWLRDNAVTMLLFVAVVCLLLRAIASLACV